MTFKFPVVSPDVTQLLWRKHANITRLIPELEQQAASSRHRRRDGSPDGRRGGDDGAAKGARGRRKGKRGKRDEATEKDWAKAEAEDAARTAAEDGTLVGFDGWLLGAGGDNARKLLHEAAPSVQRAQLALLKQA